MMVKSILRALVIGLPLMAPAAFGASEASAVMTLEDLKMQCDTLTRAGMQPGQSADLKPQLEVNGKIVKMEMGEETVETIAEQMKMTAEGVDKVGEALDLEPFNKALPVYDMTCQSTEVVEYKLSGAQEVSVSCADFEESTIRAKAEEKIKAVCALEESAEVEGSGELSSTADTCERRVLKTVKNCRI